MFIGGCDLHTGKYGTYTENEWQGKQKFNCFNHELSQASLTILNLVKTVFLPLYFFRGPQFSAPFQLKNPFGVFLKQGI